MGERCDDMTGFVLDTGMVNATRGDGFHGDFVRVVVHGGARSAAREWMTTACMWLGDCRQRRSATT